jgi:hypothetical protein
MALRASMLIGFIAFGLALSAPCEAQVMQRIVVPPAAPTTPEQTQSEPTAADKAAADQPPTDPASNPPTEDSPPGAVPAPTSITAAPEPKAGAGTIQGPAPAARAGAGMMALSPAATMTAWFERMPGCAKRISIASLTQIYVIGCSSTPDTKSFRWKNGAWQPVSGGDANAIAAVDSLPVKKNKFNNLASGLLAISSDGTARFAALTGANFGGYASYTGIQEAASGGGWLWAIGPASGNHLGGSVRRSDGVPESDCKSGMGVGDTGICSDYEWSDFGNVYATRIAAGLSDAVAWIIGEDGKIYRQVNSGDGWIEKPGCATSIANAGSDNVWVIGCGDGDANGNRGIYQWNGSGWVSKPGSGVEIAVQADGKPWVLQSDGSIWRLR